MSAAELYAWMAQYTRYDTTFAYSNAIAQRLTTHLRPGGRPEAGQGRTGAEDPQ